MNQSHILKLNTSNTGKFADYQRLFAEYGIMLNATHIDLPEIDADPIQVIVHKSSTLSCKFVNINI